MAKHSLKRSLTGIRPSGKVHIGNYLGMIRPALQRQKDYQCLYFIADLHALTTNKDRVKLLEHTLDLVAAWLAFGFDKENNLIFTQSDVPLVTELAWYLSCCTGVGFLEKAHAYKDAVAQNRDVNHGVFAYPVLMAADILLYDSDVVPVGKDQKQHVEMARDMAGSFNAAFGEEVIKLPEPLVDEAVMSIPGLDGRKMSKSYGNEIPVFADRQELERLIMAIKTDSTPLEAPKVLSGSIIGGLFAPLASQEEFEKLERRLAAGGLGWGHAKQELIELLNRRLEEPRQRYGELRKDEKHLRSVLDEGAERAFEIGQSVLNRIRHVVGYRPYPYRHSSAG